MCGLEGGQPSVRGPEPGSPRWRSVALTLALPLPLPTQGKSPTHAHHPWPGRDARGDRWSGLPPSTAGAQAGTTLRGGPRTAGGLASFPSPFSPPLGYSHLALVRREEVPRRVLSCAGMRVNCCADRDGPSLGRPPFYQSVPSPAHRPSLKEAGPSRSGPRGAGRRYPRRDAERAPKANALDVEVTWHGRRATQLLANDSAGTAGSSAPWPLSSSR